MKNRMKKHNLLGALALAGALGASGVAMTASVDAPEEASYAGYGTVEVSGGALTSLTYTLDSLDESLTSGAELSFASAFDNTDTVVSVKTDDTDWVDCEATDATDDSAGQSFTCDFSESQSLADIGTVEVSVHDRMPEAS